MTAISLPEEKNPSQVAQELTPWPMRACSEGRLSQRAEAPLAMMRVRVWMVSLPTRRADGVGVEVDAVEVGHAQLGAEAGGLLLHVLDELGALDALGPAGEVFDQRGDGELAAGLVALEDEGLEVGAGGVDGGGESGATGTEDDCVACRDLWHMGFHSVNARRRERIHSGVRGLGYDGWRILLWFMECVCCRRMRWQRWAMHR